MPKPEGRSANVTLGVFGRRKAEPKRGLPEEAQNSPQRTRASNLTLSLLLLGSWLLRLR